jgi:hypothetical protein
MALWSNTDANTGAPKFAVASGLGVSANGRTLYANTQTSAFVTNANVGLFGVDTNEIANTSVASKASKPAHAGWILRKAGTGNRVGRVQTEVLVAMGSMTGDGSASANDDVIFQDTAS